MRLSVPLSGPSQNIPWMDVIDGWTCLGLCRTISSRLRVAQSSSGTYRSMGPLMVPAKALSSILVKYLFLWRSLRQESTNLSLIRETLPSTFQSDWQNAKQYFPKPHHCTFLSLHSLVSKGEMWKKKGPTRWFKLDSRPLLWYTP